MFFHNLSFSGPADDLRRHVKYVEAGYRSQLDTPSFFKQIGWDTVPAELLLCNPFPWSKPLRKAIARVDWVVATARSLREKEHKHLATSIAQGGWLSVSQFRGSSMIVHGLNTRCCCSNWGPWQGYTTAKYLWQQLDSPFMTLEALDNDWRKECEDSSKCKQEWLNMVELGMYILVWWFGTFFVFPYIGNNHPNWLICFRGVETTNQYLFGLLCLYLFGSVFCVHVSQTNLDRRGCSGCCLADLADLGKPVVFAGMGHTCYDIISYPSIQ